MGLIKVSEGRIKELETKLTDMIASFERENAELRKQADSLLVLLEYSIFVDKCRNASNLSQEKADEIVRGWENKRQAALDAAKGAGKNEVSDCVYR